MSVPKSAPRLQGLLKRLFAHTSKAELQAERRSARVVGSLRHYISQCIVDGDPLNAEWARDKIKEYESDCDFTAEGL